MNRTSDLAHIFARLRPLFAKHESKCVVLKDEPDAYLLGTQEVREKDGYRTFFGGVETKKSYVSVHLMPVYVHTDLLDDIDPALRKRMQGKSCFNFREANEGLFASLGELVDKSASHFEADGRIGS